MFKRFSYKQRIKLLPVGFAIALLLIYWIAIHDTVKLRQNCKALIEESRVAGDAPQQIAITRSKLDEINAFAGKKSNASETDPLLEFVSNSNTSKLINLVDYQPVHTFQHQNYQVETRIAVFESSYTNLLKFLYNLEKDFKSGKLVSVRFQTETNLKTERKRLLMTLYMQSVRNEETANNESSTNGNE